MRNSRHFYAINRGVCPNLVHRFAALAEALAWVGNDPHNRAIIASRSSAARAAVRYAALGLEWPQRVSDESNRPHPPRDVGDENDASGADRAGSDCPIRAIS
jgi:hypothetical protein